MEKEKYNEQICRIIWHDVLQNSIKPFSWEIDFCNVKVIDRGTAFYLFKIRCWVEIRFLSELSLYQIAFKPENQKSQAVYNCVPLDKIVNVIDDTVQYGLSSYDYICSKYGLVYKVAI